MVAVPAGSPAARRGGSGQGGGEYFSITQAATLLGVSRVSIWRWIRAGHLPAARLGHRTTRIKRADLDRILIRMGGQGRRADWRAHNDAEHLVQFYENDAFLLDAVAEFLVTAMRNGDAAVSIATPAHAEGLAGRLRAAGIDLEAAEARGAFLSLDAAETLARFMAGDSPDPDQERFHQAIGAVLDRAAAGGRKVRAFGEMVALLVDEGNHAGAIRLEALWNDIQRQRPFALFCVYPMDRFGGTAMAAVLDAVCAEHSRVVPAESFSGLLDIEDRLRVVAVLQQRARSLEAEVAQRARVEERLRAALAAERAARTAAETALRVRDEFLSIAAHELRTPLTSLSGHAQMLLRWIERGEILEQERLLPTLRMIRGQSAKLGQLIGQLLDVSRLEEGRLTLDAAPTDLVALLRHSVDAFQARGIRHTIALRTPPSLEARVDALRLEQVVMNLLDNAVRYSPIPGGEPSHIEPIDVVLAPAGAGWVSLSVRDHGLGISVDKRDKLFERFFQAHENGHMSGLGLGLYISRQIVELHGGQIQAEFPSDGGTRFTVRLPR